MTRALINRLSRFLDDAPAAEVMTPLRRAHWMNGPNPAADQDDQFGSIPADVHRIMVHATAGWPTRAKYRTFTNRYAVPGTPHRGEGPQYFIPGDGTVMRVIEVPRMTYHAGDQVVNFRTIGVETGNCVNTATLIPSFAGARWTPVTAAVEDRPGAKLWTRWLPEHPGELAYSWWTTANWPSGKTPPNPDFMLFTESQYRSWALLARYLCEQYNVPRDFPLFPLTERQDATTNPTLFREIALAYPGFEQMVRELKALYNDIDEADFELANFDDLEASYRHLVADRNQVWRFMFQSYRGFHGHGFSGKQAGHHNCPGPVFDWHRLAREVWDWWWFPFDIDATGNTLLPLRPYREATEATPLIEYYFDEDEPLRANVIRPGIYAPVVAAGAESPATFQLHPGSPVYAMANGELVAARLAVDGQGVSLAFALVRHEVFPLRLASNPIMAPIHPPPDQLDYAREPSFIYSLYMHLTGRTGASLPDPAAPDPQWFTLPNPDWLHRLFVRLIECEAGLALQANPATPAALRNGIEQSSRPSPDRPGILEAWRNDRDVLRPFINKLRNGEVAIAPPRSAVVTPIRVLLGDYLGDAGVVVAGPGVRHGIRVETFAPGLAPPEFVRVYGTAGWLPPAGAGPYALFYQSEWARALTPFDITILLGNQIDPARLNWWSDVAQATITDVGLPAAGQLDPDGWVVHMKPFEVMRWINDLTWRSEWLKYRVTDGAGSAVQCPQRPRTRRV